MLILEQAVRAVRVERRDGFVVTGAAELRLPTGAVPSGRVRDAVAVGELVRRLGETLGIRFEPVVAVVGSVDVELVDVDTSDDHATAALVERARTLADDPGDALIVLHQEESDGHVASVVALRSTVRAAARAVEDAGTARPTVDAVPVGLARLARLLGLATGRIALVDGAVTWRVHLDLPRHSEREQIATAADPGPAVLFVDGEPFDPGDRLGDLSLPERACGGLGVAAIAVPAVLARQRLLGLDLAPDLLDAHLSLALSGSGDTVDDLGVAWRAEFVGANDAGGPRRRRRR